MNDMNALREVLSCNPFSNIGDEWRRKLKKGDYSFILPCDHDFFAAYQRELVNGGVRGDAKLLTHLIPQPFVGSPMADTWVLLYNPGYTPIDEFDNLNITNKRRVFDAVVADLRAKESSAADRIDINSFFVQRDGEAEKSCLMKRQELMLRQLALDVDSDLPFYWVDDVFRTVNSRGLGNNLVGGYNWWTSMIFRSDGTPRDVLFDDSGVGYSKVEIATKKIFALEYCPYHSVHFDQSILRTLNWQEVSNGYHKFWERMIKYAKNSGKRIVVRKRWMVDGTYYGCPLLQRGEYYEFRGQKCYLDEDNIRRVDAPARTVRHRPQALL